MCLTITRRTGKRCTHPAMKNGRCWLHGGKSTGAKRLVWRPGLEKCWERQTSRVNGRLGGRPLGAKRRGREMAEAVGRVEGYLEFVSEARRVVAPAGDRHAELLLDTAELGLERLKALLAREVDPEDIKGTRLQCEMALGVNKLLAGVQAAALRGQKSDDLAAILRAIAASREG